MRITDAVFSGQGYRLRGCTVTREADTNILCITPPDNDNSAGHFQQKQSCCAVSYRDFREKPLRLMIPEQGRQNSEMLVSWLFGKTTKPSFFSFLVFMV